MPSFVVADDQKIDMEARQRALNKLLTLRAQREAGIPPVSEP
jgi:hypothetical protein